MRVCVCLFCEVNLSTKNVRKRTHTMITVRNTYETNMTTIDRKKKCRDSMEFIDFLTATPTHWCTYYSGPMADMFAVVFIGWFKWLGRPGRQQTKSGRTRSTQCALDEMTTESWWVGLCCVSMNGLRKCVCGARLVLGRNERAYQQVQSQLEQCKTIRDTRNALIRDCCWGRNDRKTTTKKSPQGMLCFNTG